MRKLGKGSRKDDEKRKISRIIVKTTYKKQHTIILE